VDQEAQSDATIFSINTQPGKANLGTISVLLVLGETVLGEARWLVCTHVELGGEEKVCDGRPDDYAKYGAVEQSWSMVPGDGVWAGQDDLF
jgi:hypothetical protein